MQRQHLTYSEGVKDCTRRKVKIGIAISIGPLLSFRGRFDEGCLTACEWPAHLWTSWSFAVQASPGIQGSI